METAYSKKTHKHDHKHQIILTCTIETISSESTLTDTSVGSIRISTSSIIMTAIINITVFNIYKHKKQFDQSNTFKINTFDYIIFAIK